MKRTEPAPPLQGAQVPVGIGWRHPHYAELLQRQPAVDFLEVHSENFFAAGGAALAVLEQGRALYPVSLHGVGLSLGSAAGLDPWHLDQLARLVDRIDPVRVSDHASFARAPYGPGAEALVVHASDLLPLPFTDEALNVLCTHVQQVQERLQRQFMVENLSAYLSWRVPVGMREWEEPAFLAALAERTGCALLVDVNNIYVNALNAQLQGLVQDPIAACRQWLDALPAHCVGELHLAGHCEVNDAHGHIVIDDHGSRVAEPVWDLYRHALERFGPVPTLIEWDTDVPALDVLLQEAARARAISGTLAPHLQVVA
ncbi:Uncharacterised protein family UPF0276 [Comamonadaceae bacterium]